MAALSKAGGLRPDRLPVRRRNWPSSLKTCWLMEILPAAKLVFRRAETDVPEVPRHRRGRGAGGPDLSSIGASAQVDYLIESMLEPGKKIKENYHSLVVVTDDGRVVTGVKVRETD